MTTAQVAKIFHAKRIKKGKYVAKCVVHNDHRPSLWIMEGKKNCTIIGCWAGCGKESILSAVGLTFSDLFADAQPDKEALREARRLQAELERKRRKAKEKFRRTADELREQRKLVLDIGKQLAWDVRNRRLAERFHYALEKYRKLDHSVVAQMVAIYGYKPDYFMVGEL